MVALNLTQKAIFIYFFTNVHVKV